MVHRRRPTSQVLQMTGRVTLDKGEGFVKGDPPRLMIVRGAMLDHMRDLEFFFPDQVQVQLADGSQHDGVRAQFTKKGTILLPVDKLPIREGDVVRRKLPNGITEEFEINHVDFQLAVHDFPPITTLTVRKRGSRLQRQQPREQTIYNLSGANPRVNVNSTDNSINVSAVDNSVVFRDLRNALGGIQDEDLREKLGVLVNRLEQSQGTASFTAPYREFLAVAANCMTVIAPFLPALSQMLK